MLKLSTLAPAYTPVFVSLSRLLGTSALMATFGTLVTVAPVLAYTLEHGSREALIIVVIVASAGMCTALFIGLAPQLWLAEAARRHKEQSLDALAKKMGSYGTAVPRLADNDKMLTRASVLIALHKEVQNAGSAFV